MYVYIYIYRERDREILHYLFVPVCISRTSSLHLLQHREAQVDVGVAWALISYWLGFRA